MSEDAKQLLEQVESCARSIRTAADSCPHLYDEMETLLVDLLVANRQARNKLNRSKADKARGDEWDRMDSQIRVLEDHEPAPEEPEPAPIYIMEGGPLHNQEIGCRTKFMETFDDDNALWRYQADGRIENGPKKLPIMVGEVIR